MQSDKKQLIDEKQEDAEWSSVSNVERNNGQPPGVHTVDMNGGATPQLEAPCPPVSRLAIAAEQERREQLDGTTASSVSDYSLEHPNNIVVQPRKKRNTDSMKKINVQFVGALFAVLAILALIIIIIIVVRGDGCATGCSDCSTNGYDKCDPDGCDAGYLYKSNMTCVEKATGETDPNYPDVPHGFHEEEEASGGGRSVGIS